MSGLKDLGMRAFFPFALDKDCVLTLSSDALKNLRLRPECKSPRTDSSCFPDLQHTCFRNLHG